MTELTRTPGRQSLLNVWADDLSMVELMAHLDEHGGVVFTVNPEHLYHLQYNASFTAAYRKADIVTVDSHYIQLMMRLQGRRVHNRLTGSDIVPAFCTHQAANPAAKIFLLGARPGVARMAADNINRRVGRELVVGAHGPSMNFGDDPAEVEAVLAMIRASGANALVLGLSAPRQEILISEIRHRLPEVRIMMGVGATIDYEAGEVKRAPVFLRRVGLEWAYRVFTEPRRYLKRYVRNARFVWWMLMDFLGRYRDPFPASAGTLSR